MLSDQVEDRLRNTLLENAVLCRLHHPARANLACNVTGQRINRRHGVPATQGLLLYAVDFRVGDLQGSFQCVQGSFSVQ